MSIPSSEILSSHPLQYGTTKLEYTLKSGEIPSLRRFINLFVGQENDLFHNHQAVKKYYYRYPLVQYKSLERQAVIMGIGEKGINALNALMEHQEFRDHCIQWMGEQFATTELITDELKLYSPPQFPYRLHHYIALNSSNLRQWQEQNSLPARAALLERCITGHILKFCSAVQWLLPPKSLKVELLDFRLDQTHAFNNPFLAFELLFRSNISLPDHIGLGKAVSHGFGLLENYER